MQKILSREWLEALKKMPPVIWCYGYSAAGKSTLAQCLCRTLRDEAILTSLLDGDVLRKGLCGDLGFSLQDRAENIRRIAEAAVLLADAGITVVVACITPREADRALARSIIGQKRFFDVFVDTPLDECKRRDPKGLYKKALAGELPDFTGVDSPFERPCAPAMRIVTFRESPERMAETVFITLAGRR
jgi:adenylyl-sulfate kinase